MQIDKQSGNSATVTPYTLRVSLDPGGDAEWTVSGDLYLPAGSTPRTVQLLVSGLTYDRRYWTVPGIYDYTQYALQAGYAVFAFDRIGTGQSGRPPAEAVTVDAHVTVLHQLVQALRTGGFGGNTFTSVIAVGHSFGAGLAIVEAARYQDVEGLVVSGMLHTTAPLYDEVINFFHPAGEDPVLGPKTPPEGYPPYYVTQRPGARSRMLENPEEMDPEISQYNEEIKSTATLGEGQSLPQTYQAEFSRAVKVPVLIVVGERDALFSGAAVSFAADSASVHEFEKDFYAPEARLETHVIPRAGHSLNIHRNAPDWFKLTHNWADRWVGNGLP